MQPVRSGSVAAKPHNVTVFPASVTTLFIFADQGQNMQVRTNRQQVVRQYFLKPIKVRATSVAACTGYKFYN